MSGGVEFVDQASPLTMAWSGWITLLVEDCAVVIVEEVHGMSSPPEVYFVAAPQARSVMIREWEFLWSCQVLWMIRANSF